MRLLRFSLARGMTIPTIVMVSSEKIHGKQQEECIVWGCAGEMCVRGGLKVSVVSIG
jgi:hypothetical protein